MPAGVSVSADHLTQAFNEADDAGPAPSHRGHLHVQAGDEGEEGVGGKRRGEGWESGGGGGVGSAIQSGTNPVFPRSHSLSGP